MHRLDTQTRHAGLWPIVHLTVRSVYMKVGESVSAQNRNFIVYQINTENMKDVKVSEILSKSKRNTVVWAIASPRKMVCFHGFLGSGSSQDFLAVGGDGDGDGDGDQSSDVFVPFMLDLVLSPQQRNACGNAMAVKNEVSATMKAVLQRLDVCFLLDMRSNSLTH